MKFKNILDKEMLHMQIYNSNYLKLYLIMKTCLQKLSIKIIWVSDIPNNFSRKAAKHIGTHVPIRNILDKIIAFFY
jgi:hypothetical protein